MRRKKVVIVLASALLLTGCGGQRGDAIKTEETENIAVSGIESEVSKESCCICGNNGRSLMPYYRKMDSIGIVCLNTMDISNTEVRTYDDDGNEILNGRSSRSLINSHGEGECRFSIQGTPSHGLSMVGVTYGEKSVPDWDKIKKFLCQDCLDKVISMYNDEMDWRGKDGRFPEVCLVDFKTNELYSLGSAKVSYYIRDYYIQINHEDNKDELTIFYASERTASE